MVSQPLSSLNKTHVLVSVIIAGAEVAINAMAFLFGHPNAVEFGTLMTQNMVVLPTASYFVSKITVGNMTETTSKA